MEVVPPGHTTQLPVQRTFVRPSSATRNRAGTPWHLTTGHSTRQRRPGNLLQLAKRAILACPASTAVPSVFDLVRWCTKKPHQSTVPAGQTHFGIEMVFGMCLGSDLWWGIRGVVLAVSFAIEIVAPKAPGVASAGQKRACNSSQTWRCSAPPSQPNEAGPAHRQLRWLHVHSTGPGLHFLVFQAHSPHTLSPDLNQPLRLTMPNFQNDRNVSLKICTWSRVLLKLISTHMTVYRWYYLSDLTMSCQPPKKQKRTGKGRGRSKE